MYQKKQYGKLFLWLFLSAFLTLPTYAGGKKKGKDEGKKPSKKVKSIAEVTKTCKAYEGLFTLYQDTISGKSYLLIKENQINKEYIYFTHVVDGVLDAGHFRGAYGDGKIFTVQKYFNKIDLVLENTAYHFDPDNALSKAAKANINRPILASQKIVGIGKDKKKFLIEADKIFLTESLSQIKWSPRPNEKPGTRFSLGSLSKHKTRYEKIKSYPENTDVTVNYVYDNPYPKKYGHTAVTDARSVNIKVQHSFIAVPDNDFQARFDDPRIGYFTDQVTDQTSLSATPYRDLIHRWNLVKKNKEAPVSEPVEPIVWWIENTTPKELRPMIKEGVEAWNVAFEEAGFKNALVVKEQSDTASWDAGDIRYNVLRWTSSPRPPFGGYGPSFVNPRNGQILGADVMLEFIFVTNRLREENLFGIAGETEADMGLPNQFNQHQCLAGHYHQQANLFGQYVLTADNLEEKEKSEFLRQSIVDLTLHEVGHTLGLNHNFKASQLNSLAQLSDAKVSQERGLTASVMDYSPANIPVDPAKRGHYFNLKPGKYDMWAIRYGYTPMGSPKTLENILAESTKPEHGFGNDADDMRAPGRGIDPTIMIFDMSSDGIAFSEQTIKLTNNTLAKIKDKYSKKGQSYQELRNAYYILTSRQLIALRTAGRYIGGVYLDRSFSGQEGANKPYVPVPYEEQKRAMKLLTDYHFSPTAYQVDSELYQYLQSQRRGYSHWGKPQDPKIHDRILRFHEDAFNHLLHPATLKRMMDSELYGNKYSVSEMLEDVTDAVFKADLRGKVNTMRQNLQMAYVDRLTNIINPANKMPYGHISKSLAMYELNKIKKMVSTAKATHTPTKAHRQHLVFKIDKALEIER